MEWSNGGMEVGEAGHVALISFSFLSFLLSVLLDADVEGRYSYYT